MNKEKTINAAVIGAGAIGLDHIQGFQQHPKACVVAIADTNAQRAGEAARKFGIPDVVSDYRDLLKRKDLAAVSVALPNYLHFAAGMDALRAGKHVMMEKPFATHAREAARLVATAKAKRRVLMVGQNQRFSPAAQTLKQIVSRGDLGDVYHAEATFLRRSGIPRIGSWFTQKKYSGGGCLYDIGVHALDLTLHLIGDFDAAAVSGQTFGKFGARGLGNGGWGMSEIAPSKPFDVEDFAVALIKMRSGRTVLLRASWAAHMPKRDDHNIALFGTEGGAYFQPLQVFGPVDQEYVIREPKPLPLLVPANRMVHFMDIVLGKAKPFVKPDESLKVQRILDAIYASSGSGREVRIKA